MIENPLAVEVLAGHFTEGDHVIVRPSGDTFTFARQVEARPS
jgi:hypothetical protein